VEVNNSATTPRSAAQIGAAQAAAKATVKNTFFTTSAPFRNNIPVTYIITDLLMYSQEKKAARRLARAAWGPVFIK
jgi:hypothetical protein